MRVESWTKDERVQTVGLKMCVEARAKDRKLKTRQQTATMSRSFSLSYSRHMFTPSLMQLANSSSTQPHTSNPDP
jgi:hypothetical protein